VIRIAVGLCILAAAPASDWFQWRGANRDGWADGPPAWPRALRKQWEAPGGGGYSSPVISGGSVFSFRRAADEREEIAAYDVESGKSLWKHAYVAPFAMNQYATKMGPGPFATPLVHQGRVFTVGSSGVVTAVDARTGKPVWASRPYPVNTKGNNFCGAAASPLIESGLLIVHLGDEFEAGLAGIDPASGAIRWRHQYDAPGYASPVAVELHGVRQIITLTSKRAISVNPADGTLLWSEPFPDEWIENIVTPVRDGNRIIFSGVRRGTFAVEPRPEAGKWTVKPAWENPEVTFYMSSPVLFEGKLYGFSSKKKGQIVVMDPAAGKLVWGAEGRGGENAALVAAGQHLLALSDSGQLAVYRSGTPAPREMAKYQVAASQVWAHPAVTGRGVVIQSFTSLSYWTW